MNKKAMKPPKKKETLILTGDQHTDHISIG
jgi:hypothetical protein